MGAIVCLRTRDRLRKKIDLLLRARPCSEQHVDHLVEIEQPERQTQVAGIEHQRLVGEGPPIFVMRIEDEDPQIGLRAHNLMQQEDDCAGFADSSRA
jgi:hypothetical protein